MECSLNKTNRNSGVELLKIFAIFFIVLAHTCKSLTDGGILDLNRATTNTNIFILFIFRHGGILGNLIFFISSAWYFLDNNNFNIRKWLSMIIEIWLCSITILLGFYFIRGGGYHYRKLSKACFLVFFQTIDI